MNPHSDRRLNPAAESDLLTHPIAEPSIRGMHLHLLPPLRGLRALAALGFAAMLFGCTTGTDSFKDADTDQDDKLSKKELGFALLEAVFASADANGDGRVTFEEWKIVNPGADAARFAEYDSNHDGTISPGELLAFTEKKKSFDKLFTQIDTSGDGAVDREEAKEYYEWLQSQDGATNIEKLSNATSTTD